MGIFRNAKDLQNGVDRLLELSERAKHIGLHGSVKGFTPELSMALRVPGMIKLRSAPPTARFSARNRVGRIPARISPRATTPNG